MTKTFLITIRDEQEDGSDAIHSAEGFVTVLRDIMKDLYFEVKEIREVIEPFPPSLT